MVTIDKINKKAEGIRSFLENNEVATDSIVVEKGLTVSRYKVKTGQDVTICQFLALKENMRWHLGLKGLRVYRLDGGVIGIEVANERPEPILNGSIDDISLFYSSWLNESFSTISRIILLNTLNLVSSAAEAASSAATVCIIPSCKSNSVACIFLSAGRMIGPISCMSPNDGFFAKARTGLS